MKKLLFLGLLFGGGISTILLSSNNNPNDPQAFYYAQPPIPLEYTVQKLAQPLEGGENLILRIQFVDDSAMQNRLNIYNNGSVAMTLLDNGVYPDAVAGDYKYAVYLKVDIQSFITALKQSELNIKNKGYYLDFEGHAGNLIKYQDLELFDDNRFNSNNETKVNAYTIEAITDCSTIKKENSLFITDISVVENPSTTFNIVSNSGNIDGAWTFGTLIKNICNEPFTGIKPKDFLKEWVKNGRMSPEYHDYYIRPWIIKVRTLTDPNYTYPVSNPDWEAEWDDCDDELIYQYAPFKLTAIVNRMDLRGNIAYNSSLLNSGETRFIYSYVAPYDLPLPPSTQAGKAPFHRNADFAGSQAIDKSDWQGYNVIFEFTNVQNTLCDAQSLAKKWIELSDESLGSLDFIAKLKVITDYVTIANSAPSNTNNNKSAIARIRSNEKMFAPAPSTDNTSWSAAHWEFRQFEIDPNTKMFKTAPLTNTPKQEYNKAFNLYQNASSSLITDWIFQNNITKHRVLEGNHNIPLAYNNATLLDENAENKLEFPFYFGLLNIESKYDITNLTQAQLDAKAFEAKKIRRQISVNTCQGCHSGETKTAFVQVRPLGYGEEAKYWEPNNMDIFQGPTHFDTRFYNYVYNGPSPGGISMRGYTHRLFSYIDAQQNQIQIDASIVNNSLQESPANIYFQNVSPFLTGRRYSAVGNWEDDNVNPNLVDNDISDPTNDKLDNLLTGLFYVNDPSNTYTPWDPANIYGAFPGLGKQLWGYNDLEIRRVSLCALANLNCNDPIIISTLNDIKTNLPQLIQSINFIPFPIGSH